MTFEQRYKAVYRDIYDFHKKYYDAVTDEEWLNYPNDAAMLEEKYRDTEFVAEWLSVIFDELGRFNSFSG